MNSAEQPEAACLTDLGARLRRERLRADVTQEELARRAGVAQRTVQNLEAGRGGSLRTLVRVLRALGRLDDLEGVVPDPGPSPIELARRRGRERQRASGKRPDEAGSEEGSDWEW